LTSEVSSTGIKALSKLQHLEQFIFADGLDWELESEYIDLCAKYLPQLKVIGRIFDFLSSFFDYDLPEGYHNEMLKHLQQPAVLGLRLLTLEGDCQPNENVHFPELEVLILWSPTKGMLNLCDRFESVSTLAIHCDRNGCDLEDVMSVLCRVGQRLHSLLLSEFNRLSLADVLLNCPRLKCFAVQLSRVNQAPVLWPTASFTCLEEVNLQTVQLPPGFLKQVNT